jgi:hypothetical protein
MKRLKGYRPPRVSKYPDYERGYAVQCPLELPRKGRPTIKKGDPIVSRYLCAIRYHGEDCKLCPNNNFEVVLEKIGDREDFKWLDHVLESASRAVDAKITQKIRARGDCCLHHRDCILVKLDLEMTPSGLMNKTVAKDIYDMIMKAGEKAAIHDVVHVTWQKRSEALFRLVIAMRRR